MVGGTCHRLSKRSQVVRAELLVERQSLAVIAIATDAEWKVVYLRVRREEELVGITALMLASLVIQTDMVSESESSSQRRKISYQPFDLAL